MNTGSFARTLTVLVSLVAILGACGDSPTQSSDSPTSLTVSPRNQWAGGAVQIESALFSSDTLEIEVLADGRPLESSFVGPGTIEATLPGTANGAIAITVSVDGEQFGAGEVETYGFVESRLLTPSLHRGIQEWPAAFGAAVVAGKGDGFQEPRGVAILNLSTGAAVEYDSIHNHGLQYWPGISSDRNEVYLRPVSSTNVLWRLTIAVPPAPIDSFAEFGQLGGNNWSMARLGPDLWIAAGHHTLGVFRGPDQSGAHQQLLQIPAEETQGYAFLPAAGRVAPAANFFWDDGIPAFDTQSGQIAYRVKDLKSSYAIAADPASNEFIMAGLDTLAVLGGGRTHSVVIADGINGATKRTRSLDWTPLDAEYEAASGLIYIETGASILVLDKATLETRGHLHAVDVDGWDVELVLSPDEGLMYVVYGDSSNQGTYVHTYRLKPGR